MRLTVYSVALAIACLAALVSSSNAVAEEGGQFVVLRTEIGDRLQYRVVPKDQWEGVKDEIEESAKPEKAKVKKLSDEYATPEEAEAAWHEDADKTGYVTCWRCNGQGEVDQVAEVKSGGLGLGSGARPSGGGTQIGQREKCKICRTKGRIKSDGWAILRAELGQNYGFIFARKSMLDYLADLAKRGTGLMGAGSSDKIVMKSVKTFPAGKFDEAKTSHMGMEAESDGKPGFQRGIQGMIPGFPSSGVEWPGEFFAK